MDYKLFAENLTFRILEELRYTCILLSFVVSVDATRECAIRDSLSRRQGVLQMASFIFLVMCVMVNCCAPIVMSMVPVVYNVHHPQCGETHYSNTQRLTEILEQVSRDIDLSAIEILQPLRIIVTPLIHYLQKTLNSKHFMRIPHLLYKPLNSRKPMNANNCKLHHSVKH